MKSGIKCAICGELAGDYIANHLAEAHDGMTVAEYSSRYPDAPTVTKRLLSAHKAKKPTPRRAHPPTPEDLTVDLNGIKFPLNLSVPEEACLPLPPAYRLPCHGKLGEAITHALVSLRCSRSLYVWGLPGSGKDALFHAVSALTRRPAIMRTIQPGSDVEAWYFSRSFNDQGTFWEEGEVLKALRDGYKCEDGTVVPYMLLISDLDRADESQAEYLRLITDSIQGRIGGPAGKTYKVLPGSQVVATGNSPGSGDQRGRCVSSRPLDASILDRIDVKLEFPWMSWEDEEPIMREKFPMLAERAPNIFTPMGAMTKSLRKAINESELYAEFSHRALCSILGHAEDLLKCLYSSKKVPKTLLREASRAWLDGLPDQATKQAARRLMDPHIKGGMVAEADGVNENSSSLIDGL